MSAIETLRAVLVGATVLAAAVAALFGLWLTVAVLVAAILVHGYTTLYLRKLRLGQAGTPPTQPGAPS